MLSEKEAWNKSRFFRKKMMFSIFCRQMWRLSWKLKLLMRKTNWTKAKILEFAHKDDCRSFLLLLWNWVNTTTKDSFLTTLSSSQKRDSYCMHCKKEKNELRRQLKELQSTRENESKALLALLISLHMLGQFFIVDVWMLCTVTSEVFY